MEAIANRVEENAELERFAKRGVGQIHVVDGMPCGEDHAARVLGRRAQRLARGIAAGFGDDHVAIARENSPRDFGPGNSFDGIASSAKDVC